MSGSAIFGEFEVSFCRYQSQQLTPLGRPVPNHHAIFVQTTKHETGGTEEDRPRGVLYGVDGRFQYGEECLPYAEEKRHPQVSYRRPDIIPIGKLKADKYPTAFQETLALVPPPPLQYDEYGVKQTTYEVYHCQHWVRDVLRALAVARVYESYH
jgi:hypothetical protein